MLDFQRASSSLKYPPTKRSQMSEAARRIFAPSSLVTSRVLVADASPSGGGRGQLRRSPFPSLMRLRHPGVKLEHKGHIYFTIVDFFIIQNGCYHTVVSHSNLQSAYYYLFIKSVNIIRRYPLGLTPLSVPFCRRSRRRRRPPNILRGCQVRCVHEWSWKKT